MILLSSVSLNLTLQEYGYKLVEILKIAFACNLWTTIKYIYQQICILYISLVKIL